MGMNTYFIRGSEVIDSSLETIDSSLTQQELDKLLAFSEQEKISSNPQCLHFIMHGSGVILEKKNGLEAESLFNSKLPSGPTQKWPKTLRGIPCSQGIVIAPCTFNLKNAQGKIFVTSHLNVKDFSSLEGIKGLVLETGSILSHVGVLSRERNIPCIIGMKEARLIPEGDIIRLDGFTGLINQVP